MSENLGDAIRYPIGLYKLQPYSEDLRQQWFEDIRMLPGQLQSVVQGLTVQQLQTAYREKGWPIFRIVHHIADAQYQRLYPL